MYSSKLDLCRLLSNSCYSNHAHHQHSCYSNDETYVERSDVKGDDSCWKLGNVNNHIMEIHEENVVNIDLPPLVWFEYNKTPKLLSATNTGRTILINGQWACGRPYITGGPLNGSYIFSQIHFHSPSEHEIDGRRYPLEMHVVHYKNSYLTQERAMKEKDGTIVLVYLFQLIECGATIVSQVSKLASCLEKRNARRELNKFPLDQFVKPFNTNYYTYQSAIPADKNNYLLQWIISCNNLCVTREEVDELLFVMNANTPVTYSTTLQPEDDVVFRVGEDDFCGWMTEPQVPQQNPCCQHQRVCSHTSVCKKGSKGSICRKGSKGSICRRGSKGSICRRGSKGSICRGGSKGSLCRRGSKGSICRRGSNKSFREKSCKTFINKKSTKKCVNKKRSKTIIHEKTCEKSVDSKCSGGSLEKCSKASADDKYSKANVRDKCSKVSICEEKPSNTSISDKSSETSCASEKGKKKKKKRKKSKMVIVCDGTCTTPCSSKCSVRRSSCREPKDVYITREKSKSKSRNKSRDRGGTSETSVEDASTCKSKEKIGEKRSKKKLGGTKRSKTKMKKCDGGNKEKSVDIHKSRSTDKSDCSEANLKTKGKSKEKVKVLYKKKGKAPGEPSDCNTECSNTAENNESANIGDDFETCEDVQINYLFVPSATTSAPLNVADVELRVPELTRKKSLTKTGNATVESKDFIKLPSHPIINHALVNAIQFPVVKSGETKHLYIHTKHIFRTEEDNKEFPPHTFQECHILIERDQNVLQEYNSTLYPSQLSPGNHEELNLSTKYADPDDLQIHATECIAKLESLHELSIRAKFMISDPNLNGRKSESFFTYKRSTDSTEDMKSFFDAQCQCSMEQPVSTSVALDTKLIEKEITLPCKSLIKWDLRNMGLESLDLKNTGIVSLQNIDLRVGNEVNFRTGDEGRNSRRALVEQGGSFKLVRASGPEWEAMKSLLEQKNEQEADSAMDDDKGIKNPLDRQKRTTYFVYDRIEKDENSGKKIFIGNFRSRDEIKVLFKPDYLSLSDGICNDLPESESNNNATPVSGNESNENASEQFLDSQVEGASKENDPDKKTEHQQRDHKKEVITLHKFEPKHVKGARKKSKSHIVGKISSKVDTESEKYSQLVNILGVNKTRLPKISFYEFHQSDGSNGNNVGLDNSCKFDVITLKAVEDSGEIDKGTVLPSSSKRSDCLNGEISVSLEGPCSSVEKPGPSDSKDSQAAVIVLPIEVDSLSKVEIVLIEHSDDVKKQKVDDKYTSYLKHYKRFILKLMSSFL